jgi:hypothetical protein
LKIIYQPLLTNEPAIWHEEACWVLERLGYAFTENEDGTISWEENDEEEPIHRRVEVAARALALKGYSLERMARILETSKTTVRRALGRIR